METRGRISSLDGLRGISILLVLIGHGAYSLPAFILPALGWAENGALGVNVFFVLSGFLIYNLSIRETEKDGSFDWRRFYIRRVLRIFPCFYLFIGAILLLKEWHLVSLPWTMLLSASSFSLNYRHLWDHSSGGSDYHVIGHYWTLALEEQFYLTWPLLMMLFIQRKLLPVLVAVVLVAPVIRIATYFLAPDSRGQIGMMFHTGFDSIAAGVLLGELLLKPTCRTWLLRLAQSRLMLFGIVIFLFFVSPLLNTHLRGAYSMVIGKSFELAGICILVTASISFPGSALFRVLNWRPLAYIGILSYSLYVWNNLFLYPEGKWLLNAFPWNFLCVAGMALVSHYAVEKPFLKLKDMMHRRSPLRIGPLGIALQTESKRHST